MRFQEIPNNLTNSCITFVILVSCCSFLSLIAYAKVYAEEDPLVAEPRVFKADSNQEASPIKVGETFHIVLEANPSTGYQWQVVGLDTSIFKPGDVKFRRKSKLLGAPEEQIMPFTALRRAETSLELRYKRPWEKETRLQSLQSFTIYVTVTD